MMEIQLHDGVVVDVAGLGRASLSFCEREREVLQGRREAPKAVGCCPPSPLYIVPLGGAGPGRWDLQGRGGGQRGEGVALPPKARGNSPLGFPTLGAWG